MKEKLHYKDLELGDEGRPLEYVITEELVNRYSEATGNYSKWHTKDSPFGVPIAHTTLNSLDYFAIIFLKWQKEWTGLHARQETEMFAPLKLGQKVRVTGKIVEKYEKKGRKYIKLEYTTRDENGSEILKNRLITSIDD